MQNVFWYLEPFKSDSWVRRTDRRTDSLIAYAALHFVARPRTVKSWENISVVMWWLSVWRRNPDVNDNNIIIDVGGGTYHLDGSIRRHWQPIQHNGHHTAGRLRLRSWKSVYWDLVYFHITCGVYGFEAGFYPYYARNATQRKLLALL